MEYLDSGDLFQKINKQKSMKKYIGEDEITKIFY